ncbi:MAG: hypothetical protein KME64_41000 [Scytonematopsis contorta HA4267-MV1]|jgi:hypothetical protein|nr:hypothetical protein [Scytonematopsis contorta HA4267-MV1]
MILYLSILAQDPQRVAQVLAEIIHGQSVPYPLYTGSYIIFPRDENGVEIEVTPLVTESASSKNDDNLLYQQSPSVSKATDINVAISVPTNIEQIEQIAQREGWHTQRRRVGNDYGFNCIELWVENRFLINCLTPDMTAEYISFVKPEYMKKLLILNHAIKVFINSF